MAQELQKTTLSTGVFPEFLLPRQVRRMLQRLKELLDELGSCQDLTVQIRTLREMGGHMQAEGEGEATVRRALGALVANLGARQRAERARFSQAFVAFDSRRERHQLKDRLRS